MPAEAFILIPLSLLVIIGVDRYIAWTDRRRERLSDRQSGDSR